MEDISCVDVLVTNWTEEPQKQEALKKIAGNGVRIVYSDDIKEGEI